jgi:DNA-binding LytR/AlgR family response regulator
MSTIKVYILDDEVGSVEYLVDLLESIPEVEIAGFSSNPKKALDEVYNIKPEILFLDYHMPGLDGFSFYDALTLKGYYPVTVYVTAYDDQGIDACRRSAFDYLLKPVLLSDIQQVIDKYSSMKVSRNVPDSHKCSKLKFNLRSGFVLIDPLEIVYCRAEGNYTDIFLLDGRKITITVTLGKVAELLPDNQIFRINRSFIINIRFLVSVDRKFQKAIMMFGGRNWEVPINGSQTRELEDYLENTLLTT